MDRGRTELFTTVNVLTHVFTPTSTTRHSQTAFGQARATSSASVDVGASELIAGNLSNHLRVDFHNIYIPYVSSLTPLGYLFSPSPHNDNPSHPPPRLSFTTPLRHAMLTSANLLRVMVTKVSPRWERTKNSGPSISRAAFRSTRVRTSAPRCPPRARYLPRSQGSYRGVF